MFVSTWIPGGNKSSANRKDIAREKLFLSNVGGEGKREEGKEGG